MVLTFESVDRILWCDHSNETSAAVLLNGTICFNILQNEIWHLTSGALGSFCTTHLTDSTQQTFFKFS